VLAAAPLTIVLVSHHDPLLAFGLVATRDLGHRDKIFVGQCVLGLPGFTGEGIDPSQQHVVADPVQVTAISEPGTGRRNVIGGALALDLDQQRQLFEILSIPG